MKKLIVLALFLALSVFALQGTSNAVDGVVDDVPGTDVIFPIMCEKGGTMNTLYAITEVFGVGATADLVVYDIDSNPVYDDVVDWTPLDVLSGDCQALVAGMSPVQQAALEATLDGTTYYAGYIVFYNWNWPDWDQFISSVYLVDLPKGFASGFNGWQAEGMFSSIWSDGCEYDSGIDFDVCQTAVLLFPRYLIMNGLTETFNWWMVFYTDYDAARVLSGLICNEEEDCISLDIPVPHEFNVINVEPFLPVILHAGYPKAGFGWFFNVETDYDNMTYGWAYQRAEGSTLAATWDVIHPIQGVYFPVYW